MPMLGYTQVCTPQRPPQIMGWIVLPHPPYSPPIAPTDYHLLYSFSVHVCYFHYLLPTHAQLIKTLHTSHLKLYTLKCPCCILQSFDKNPTCFG